MLNNEDLGFGFQCEQGSVGHDRRQDPDWVTALSQKTESASAPPANPTTMTNGGRVSPSRSQPVAADRAFPLFDVGVFVGVFFDVVGGAAVDDEVGERDEFFGAFNVVDPGVRPGRDAVAGAEERASQRGDRVGSRGRVKPSSKRRGGLESA